MKLINPFKKDPRYRLELAFEKVPENTKSLLDFGCSDGRLLEGLKKKIPTAILVGVDVEDSRLKIAQKKVKAKFIKLKNADRLPLESGIVEIVTLLDVLEHVPYQGLVIREIYRVLKPDGKLFLSVPHKGLTEIFDPGNIKFRFPRLHRFLYETVFKQKNYVQNYLGKEHTGDISVQDKMWHKHYNLYEIKKILGKKFKIETVNYYGLLLTAFSMLDQVVKWVFNKEISFLSKLIIWDSRKNFGKLSFSIFVCARKI